ncbi:MAG: hypothetical protein Q9217_001089 [Psora testacea]
MQEIQAIPQMIQEYNCRRNIVFRRFLLAPDPDSEAFQDNHYKSAFTDSLTKICRGGPGVFIVRPPSYPPPDPTAELQDALEYFDALQNLWLAYKNPCSKDKCPICQINNDGKQGKEDGSDDKDDGNEEDGEEDKEDNEDFISSSRKSRKGGCQEAETKLHVIREVQPRPEGRVA